MKTRLIPLLRRNTGFALLMVMSLIAVGLIVLAATMQRTSTVANLNARSNQYLVNNNAAEAALEKVFARMAYDFTAFGPGGVANNLSLYRTNIPNENGFWNNFEFSDAQGNLNQVYIQALSNYSGAMPSQYAGKSTISAPVYRLVANARNTSGAVNTVGTAQMDVLLALVPLSTYAIFYNGLLEFSTAATMTINGRVHANANIYLGSGQTVRFNNTVTTAGAIGYPRNNGQGPWTGNTASNVEFNGSPNYRTNTQSVTLPINMTNTYALIEQPPAGESPTSQEGQERLYNKAQVVLLVSNTVVQLRLQESVSEQVPGADPSPVILTYTNTSPQSLATNLPFLSLTNRFKDQRENKEIVTTQIDVAKYGQWIATNTTVQSKFPAVAGLYPTVLYVADNRTVTSGKLTGVRLANGSELPKNNNLGWSVATPNPLYVWNNYNVSKDGITRTATTNTTATVPAALMSDALTILSGNWNDTTSYTDSDTGPVSASSITINAALLTGIVPSTGNTSATFSGGVHNLPRLLENWSTSRKVWLNTSIINLFNSRKATGRFITPGRGSYYVAPRREFSYDLNFLDPNKQPPGMPCAMIPIRFNWATPPPNTVTYNATP